MYVAFQKITHQLRRQLRRIQRLSRFGHLLCLVVIVSLLRHIVGRIKLLCHLTERVLGATKVQSSKLHIQISHGVLQIARHFHGTRRNFGGRWNTSPLTPYWNLLKLLGSQLLVPISVYCNICQYLAFLD